MPVIKNGDDIKKIIEGRIKLALKMTQDEIYKVIESHISDYYSEKVFRNRTTSTPSVYGRTYKFLNSLIKTNLVSDNNSLSCKIEIDEDFLRYQYPGSEWYGGLSATGLDVANWANDASHGGIVPGKQSFWNDALAELGGSIGIKMLMQENLKKVGIPISK